MQNDANLIRQYEYTIQSREHGASDPFTREEHQIDWKDAPSRFTIYNQAARVSLSPRLTSRSLTLGMRGSASSNGNYPSITAEELSDFLLLTIGILRRKLTINWNYDPRDLMMRRTTTYSRGTASGGGLYPVDAYVIACEDKILPAAVYHYDVAHHALVRLRVGAFNSTITSLLEYQDTGSAELLVVLTARFWRNCFKYQNFSYQLITQDVGAVIGSMEQVAYSLAWNATAIYWFNDRLLASLLDLDSDQAAPFAVLALARHGSSEPYLVPDASDYIETTKPDALPEIHAHVRERSKKIVVPELLQRVHNQTLIQKVERPPLLAQLEDLVVNPCTNLNWEHPVDLCSIMRTRETSFGRFRLQPAVDFMALKTILSFAINGTQYRTDLYGPHVPVPLVRLSLIAQNVQNLSSGVYQYHSSTSELLLHPAQKIPGFLQSTYFLPNYNLDQIAIILVVISKLELVLSNFGARGIRVMNAEAGIVAQRVYMATSALSLGCGVVAGFAGGQISKIVGLDGNEEIPLLLIFVGHELPGATAFDFRLY